jgi:hypothetical protein
VTATTTGTQLAETIRSRKRTSDDSLAETINALLELRARQAELGVPLRILNREVDQAVDAAMGDDDVTTELRAALVGVAYTFDLICLCRL